MSISSPYLVLSVFLSSIGAGEGKNLSFSLRLYHLQNMKAYVTSNLNYIKRVDSHGNNFSACV